MVTICFLESGFPKSKTKLLLWQFSTGAIFNRSGGRLEKDIVNTSPALGALLKYTLFYQIFYVAQGGVGGAFGDFSPFRAL